MEGWARLTRSQGQCTDYRSSFILHADEHEIPDPFVGCEIRERTDMASVCWEFLGFRVVQAMGLVVLLLMDARRG